MRMYIYLRSHFASSMDQYWLTRETLGPEYIPFQGRCFYLDGPPVIDLTTGMLDREHGQETRPGDEQYQDTLLPFGSTSEYRQLNIVTDEHITDMKRCLDIMDNWQAVLPTSKLASDVRRILVEEAAKTAALINEIAHLQECARQCLSPRSRYQATLEVVCRGKQAHCKIVETFGITKAIVEPLIDCDENPIDDSEISSDFDVEKMFVNKPKRKAKAKANGKKMSRPMAKSPRPKRMRGKQQPTAEAASSQTAEAESSQTAEAVATTGPDPGPENISLADLVQQLADTHHPGAAEGNENNGNQNDLLETEDMRGESRRLRAEAAEKRAGRRAEKRAAEARLFPQGIPIGLPQIPDERFEGARAIISIIGESDGTIRFNLKGGGVFWKDAQDEDGVMSEDFD